MGKSLTIKKFYLVILAVSIISLISAVYIEFILNQAPCKLCLYQRIPYVIAIFIAFFGFNYPNNFFWMYLLILIFILNIVLSGYHVGIENSIFEEFSSCSNTNTNITNKSDLLNFLKETMPSCKNVDFKLFGLSLATINFIISLIISVTSVIILKNEKNR